jgi:hypothetical protein
MAVPLAATTITVKGRRPQSAVDPDAEGYDAAPADPATLHTGVRASITRPQGRRSGVDDEVDSYTLSCDTVDDADAAVTINRFDTIVDETDGVEYSVHAVMPSTTQAFGLEHIKATIKVTKGLRSVDDGSARD